MKFQTFIHVKHQVLKSTSWGEGGEYIQVAWLPRAGTECTHQLIEWDSAGYLLIWEWICPRANCQCYLWNIALKKCVILIGNCLDRPILHINLYVSIFCLLQFSGRTGILIKDDCTIRGAACKFTELVMTASSRLANKVFHWEQLEEVIPWEPNCCSRERERGERK